MKNASRSGGVAPPKDLQAVAFLILGLLIISLQGVAVKWIGGSYPVLEMVLLRNLVALPLTLLFFWMEGKRGLPVTRQPRLQLWRGTFLFLSYTATMMGLAALPLAEVEAIRFSGPVIITLLSVLMLGEKVELRRWLALITGFLGVLLIIRPGTTAFNLGSVFVLSSALFYGLTVIFTRRLQTTDSSATMAFFSSLVYLASAAVLAPVTIAAGEIEGAHPSIAFLFRSWTMPTLVDGLIMGGLGLVWAGWTYCAARAYSLANASRLAPFEYLSLPINAMWGFLFWQELLTWLTLAGTLLTLLSGLYILRINQSTRQTSTPAWPELDGQDEP